MQDKSIGILWVVTISHSTYTIMLWTVYMYSFMLYIYIYIYKNCEVLILVCKLKNIPPSKTLNSIYHHSSCEEACFKNRLHMRFQFSYIFNFQVSWFVLQGNWIELPLLRNVFGSGSGGKFNGLPDWLEGAKWNIVKCGRAQNVWLKKFLYFTSDPFNF